MPDFKLWILDLDGTVYRGAEPCPGAAEAVSAHLLRGGLVRFLTNNSGAQPAAVASKLTAMGVPAEPEWVWGTGPGARRWCEAQGLRSVYVLGDEPLQNTFSGLTGEPDEAEGVVAGICRTLTYQKLDEALQVLRRGGRFLATNRDATYPREAGRFEPGAGAIVGALAAAAQREPEAVIGKPEPELIHQILAETGTTPEQAVMAGDREETDIEAGRRAGIATWMVLTGVANELPPGQAGSEDLRGLL
jgi:4-nitrophenyl phosphatase